MKEYIVSHEYIDGIYTDEGSTFGLDMQKELIRCKDCKFSSPNQVYGCRIHSFADDLDKRMYSDDFCSRAERKEE